MNTVDHRPKKSKKYSDKFGDWFENRYGCPANEYQGPDVHPSKPPVTPQPSRDVRRALDRVISEENAPVTAPQGPPRPRARKKRKKQLTRAERRQRDAIYYRRQRDRIFGKIVDAGVYPSYVAVIPRGVWLMARAIWADRFGEAGRYFLSRCRYPAAAAIIRAEAFAGKRTWESNRARVMVAVGLVLCALSKPTKNVNVKWGRIIRGIPQNAFRAMFADLTTGKWMSKEALIGVSKPGGKNSNGGCGYLRAFYDARLVYAQQLPRDEVAPWERLGEFTLNRYWLCSNIEVSNPAERARLLDLAESEAADRGVDIQHLDDEGLLDHFGLFVRRATRAQPEAPT